MHLGISSDFTELVMIQSKGTISDDFNLSHSVLQQHLPPPASKAHIFLCLHNGIDIVGSNIDLNSARQHYIFLPFKYYIFQIT